LVPIASEEVLWHARMVQNGADSRGLCDSLRETQKSGAEARSLDDACVAAGDVAGQVYVSRDDPSTAMSPYGRGMSPKLIMQPCIEVLAPGEGVRRVSVREYEATAQRAGGLAPYARDHEGIGWAAFAPPVQKLNLEYQQPGFNLPRFRIYDWDLYDTQMRELLGLV
jgi:hypothetical protein